MTARSSIAPEAAGAGCIERVVEGEEQLIQAWNEGCERITARTPISVGPSLFLAVQLPPRENLTLSGTLQLDWMADPEHLQQTRVQLGRSSRSEVAGAGALLPIAPYNRLKLSNLVVQGSASSMGLFMEMLAAPPPGPGLLLLENTSFSLLSCTRISPMLSYLRFLSQLRPSVYPENGPGNVEAGALQLTEANSSIVVATVPPAPLQAEQLQRGVWTSEQTVGFSNFTIQCSSDSGNARGDTGPPAADAAAECRTREVHSDAELQRSRLDDCRHVVALPMAQPDGTAELVPLAANWFQWDREIRLNTTLSGVVDLGGGQGPPLGFVTYPIAADAWFQMWHLDLVGTLQELLVHMERSRAAGPGKLMLNNTRFVVTDCTPSLLPALESIVLTIRLLAGAEEDNVTVDEARGEIRYSQFTGSLAPSSGEGSFGFFSQAYSWEIYNLTVLCREVWDVQESVDRFTSLSDTLPPSLHPSAWLAGQPGQEESSVSFDAMGTGTTKAPPGGGSWSTSHTLVTVFGVLAVLLLTAMLAAVLLLKRPSRRAAAQQSSDTSEEPDTMLPQPPLGVDGLEMGVVDGCTNTASNTGTASSPFTIWDTSRTSTPAVLSLGSEESRDLLEVSSCAETLLSLAPDDTASLLTSVRPFDSCADTGMPLPSEPPSDSAASSRDMLVRVWQHITPGWAAGEGESGAEDEAAASKDGWMDSREAGSSEEAALRSARQQDVMGGRAAAELEEDMQEVEARLDGGEREKVQDIFIRVLPVHEDVDLDVDLERDVRLGRCLGEGSHSIVHEAWWRPGTEQERRVAVKTLDLDVIQSQRERDLFLQAFGRELNTLSRIKHPSIVRCFGGCVRAHSVCILLEYLPVGSLSQYLHVRRAQSPLSAREVLAVALQVASALAHLHPIIIHGDVKPDNCLLTAEGHVKLSDFGACRVKWRTAMANSQPLGTLQYIAPEVFKQEAITEKCDVYSLGVLLWECYTGRRPWNRIKTPMHLYHKVKVQGKKLQLPADSDADLAGLINSCWRESAARRPSAAEVARKAYLLRGSFADCTETHAQPPLLQPPCG